LSFVVAGEDVDEAGRMLGECLELFRRAGDEGGEAQVLSMLVIGDAQAGRWEAVVGRLDQSVAIWRRVGDRLHLAFDLVWLAFAYGRVGRRTEARSTAIESLDIFCEAENATGIGIALTDLAFLALWEGRFEDALRFAGASESLRQR